MPKQPTEPESYSVDEMMERLRVGEREKEDQSQGELVVRSDGTQVMRVRKRKRRTQQEKKPEPVKRRNPLLLLGGLLVLLFVALAVAIVVLLARYNSSGFQTGLEEALNDASGAEASFENLAVTPLAARSEKLVMTWGEDRSLHALSLSNLSADLDFGSFLGGSWDGVAVIAQSGEAIIGGTAEKEGGARLASDSDLFASYRCDFFDLHIGAPGKGIQFKNAEMSMRDGPNGETQLHLRGGDAVIPGWSTMEIDRGMAEFFDGGLKLVSLRLKSKEGDGEVSFSSEAILRDGEDVDLGMAVDALPLATFVGGEIGGLIDGVISCENAALTLDGGTLQDVALRMEFSGSSTYMQGFPFLEVLKTRLTDSEFVKPSFRTAQGVLVRGKHGVRLQELELMEKSQMAVRGHIAVDPEGELSGRLEIGIVEEKIITSTNRKRSSVFSDPVEGFCWVTINLSGTVEEPSDDFHELLRKAALEESPRNREKLLEDRLEDLTR